MDISDQSRYDTNIDGFRYMLACVDVFSPKAYVPTMKHKDTATVINAFRHLLLRKAGPEIRGILANKGPAWTNNTWLELIDAENFAF
jgi:hypothetical protein